MSLSRYSKSFNKGGTLELSQVPRNEVCFSLTFGGVSFVAPLDKALPAFGSAWLGAPQRTGPLASSLKTLFSWCGKYALLMTGGGLQS